MNTDHVEDQEKLVWLFQAFKEVCEHEVWGEEVILSLSMVDLIPHLWDEVSKNIAGVGGQEAWDCLSPDQCEAMEAETYKQVCRQLGEDELDSMTPKQWQYMALFIWGGCCMDKEMNSVKGGNSALMAFWEAKGLMPPMKLYNKDNAAVAALGEPLIVQHASDVTSRGGIKLTSLAGAVFANKDKKKCQQDTVKVEIEASIGYMVSFPDTSNT